MVKKTNPGGIHVLDPPYTQIKLLIFCVNLKRTLVTIMSTCRHPFTTVTKEVSSPLEQVSSTPAPFFTAT